MEKELCEVRNNFDKCGFCEKGDNMDIIEEIEKIIKKYLDVELIDTPEEGDIMEFNVYDFLGKELDFQNDVKSIIKEIKEIVPSYYLISKRFHIDNYWDGKKMTQSNLSCIITIDATYKDMEIISDNFLGTEEELKAIAKDVYDKVDMVSYQDDPDFMDKCESVMSCDYPFLNPDQENKIFDMIDELIEKIGEL